MLASCSYSNPIAGSSDYDPVIYLWLVIFIFLSRSLSFVKKIGLPIAIGEILTGIILGQLDMFGINLFASIEHNTVIQFLAELGSIILMFEIGLESKFSDLKKNFRRGIKLAILGSILTFSGGFFLSWLLIKDQNLFLNLLIGVICAATATGISARIFKDMGLLRTKEVRIILVSSILDELISILCFGIISVMLITQTVGFIGISLSLAQALIFFIFAGVFGRWITPHITSWSTKIHAGINMKIGVLLIICFFFSWLAHILGLAFVVGAFVAGLILDEVYFKTFSRANFFIRLRNLATQVPDIKLRKQLNNVIDQQEGKTIKELLKPISHLFVPIFFINIGMMLNVSNLLNFRTFSLTLSLILISFFGRILSGYLIREKNINNLILGLGLTPIGEAGLIFTSFGRDIGIINGHVLSAIVSAVVIASIITPILIKFSVKRYGVHRYE
jgi:Kef-type K+ transport system membrane component KefB